MSNSGQNAGPTYRSGTESVEAHGGEASTAGINAFASLALGAADCEAILIQAEQRIALVHEALK